MPMDTVCSHGRSTIGRNAIWPPNRARKIASKHLINWPEILPLTVIAKSQKEKIKRF